MRVMRFLTKLCVAVGGVGVDAVCDIGGVAHDWNLALTGPRLVVILCGVGADRELGAGVGRLVLGFGGGHFEWMMCEEVGLVIVTVRGSKILLGRENIYSVRGHGLFMYLSRCSCRQRVDIRFSVERERRAWGYDQLFFSIKFV
jgi:hypothetical protein